jgi:hypothetical protein
LSRFIYWWDLSMRQVEVSRTMVFDDPRRARGFFEALVADNIGIGRPETVAMVFARQVRKTTTEPFIGRVFSPGSEVSITTPIRRIAAGETALYHCKLELDETIIRTGCENDQRFRIHAWRQDDESPARWGGVEYEVQPPSHP